MKLVLWLFALLLLAAASAYPASAQGFREGLAAYDRGDYTTAYRVFLSFGPTRPRRRSIRTWLHV